MQNEFVPEADLALLNALSPKTRACVYQGIEVLRHELTFYPEAHDRLNDQHVKDTLDYTKEINLSLRRIDGILGVSLAHAFTTKTAANA